MPHVLMEKGDMTLGEFDQHLTGRADFIKGMKKDSSAERKVRVTEQRQWGQNWGGSGHWPRWASEKPEPRPHSKPMIPPPARPPAPSAVQGPGSMRVKVAQSLDLPSSGIIACY